MVWALAALLVFAPPELEAPVGFVHGLCLRAAPHGQTVTVGGDLLPLSARRSPHPGRVELAHGRLLDDQAAAALRRLEQALAASHVPGVAAAFKVHGVALSLADADDPVGGGSAGLAIYAAAVSALLEVAPRAAVVLTGVVDEQGRVKPVGGLKQKAWVAYGHHFRALLTAADDAATLVATQPPALFARTRVVGVEQADEVVLEVLGSRGPSAGALEQRREAWEDGLAALAAGRAAAAAEAFRELVRAAPDEPVARAWLRWSETPDAPAEVCEGMTAALAAAAAGEAGEARRLATPLLPRLGAWRQAIATALLGRLDEDHAWCQRIAPAREALQQGDLDAAQGWLDGADEVTLETPARIAVDALQLQLRLRRREATAKSRPRDPGAWLALAEAAEQAGLWTAARASLNTAREVGASGPELGRREAYACLELGDQAAAAKRLLAQLLTWPADDEARAMLLPAGVDAVAPRPVLGLEGDGRVSGVVPLRVGSDDSAAAIEVKVDGHHLARGRGTLALRWDTSSLTAGTHRLTAVAQDPAGNLGQVTRWVVTGAAGLPPVGEGSSIGGAGYDVQVTAAGTWVVRPGDRLVFHPEAILGEALAAAGIGLDQVRVVLDPPGQPAANVRERLEFRLDESPERAFDVRLCSQLADGRAIAPANFRIVRSNRPLATIAKPVEDARLGRLTLFELRVTPGFEPLSARFIIDGEDRGGAWPASLWLDPTKLPPGAHTVAVTLTDGEQRSCQTPPVRIVVARHD